MADDRPIADHAANGAASDWDARLARARAAEQGRAGPAAAAPQPAGYRQGARVLAELVGVPAGGALMGWALDRWLGTAPWLLLAVLLLSIVVAARNVYRIAQEKPE